MKKNIVLFLLLLVSSCYIANESSDNFKMIIESKEYDNRVVYYQTRNDSISKYSYVLWNTSGRTMLEINDNVSNPQYFVSQDDTSTVDYMKSFNDGRYFVPTFSGQMSELKECLRVASKDFDISKMKCITCGLMDFDSIDVVVTSALMPAIRKNRLSQSAISKELFKSCLTSSLNLILSDYNLEINTIECEKISYLHKAASGEYIWTDNVKFTPTIIVTWLYIELKRND